MYIGIVLGVIVLVVFGAYVHTTQQISGELKAKLDNNLLSPPQPSESANFSQRISTWKKYQSETMNFSFKYPSDWILFEHSNGSVELKTPSQSNANESTMLGSELFAIHKDKQSRQLDKEELDGEIYGLQDIDFSSSLTDAVFYVNPSVIEHYTWRISSRSEYYEINVMTPSELFNTQSVVTPEEYREAIDIVYTFSLNN